MMNQLSSVRPYKSFILSKASEGLPLQPLVNRILDDAVEFLSFDTDLSREHVDLVPARRSGSLSVGFLHYTQSRPAAWTDVTSVLDLINHLFLVARQGDYVCCYASDDRLRAYIARFVFPEASQGLGSLRPISEGVLNAAFVTGRARTLWLSGTHRRTTVKADNKVLSGLNLRDALDPLGDQSYHFTSARSLPNIGGSYISLGVTPRNSSVWIGKSTNWTDVRETVETILSHIAQVSTPVPDPLPVLALSSYDAKGVSHPFDLAIVPPELAADDPTVTQETREIVERWGYEASFPITSTSGLRFAAEPWLGADRLGILDFDLDLSDPTNVKWAIEARPAAPQHSSLLAQAERACKKRTWLKVWFESGHTLSNGALYQQRHRDLPFTGFVWASFPNTDIRKEKPQQLEDTGSSDSLFCWVQRTWPNLAAASPNSAAWLACDDGSMEIADFIFVDPTSDPPIVCLIHVKASHSNDPARKVSVADFQVVTAQAVKNLRYLDRLIVHDGLQQGIGKRISNLVWHNRSPSNRSAMLSALQSIGSNYTRQVVIVQPRHTRTSDSTARANPNSSDMQRLRQLDTLLIGADNDCHGLGATLTVVCDDV